MKTLNFLFLFLTQIRGLGPKKVPIHIGRQSAQAEKMLTQVKKKHVQVRKSDLLRVRTLNSHVRIAATCQWSNNK